MGRGRKKARGERIASEFCGGDFGRGKERDSWLDFSRDFERVLFFLKRNCELNAAGKWILGW